MKYVFRSNALLKDLTLTVAQPKSFSLIPTWCIFFHCNCLRNIRPERFLNFDSKTREKRTKIECETSHPSIFLKLTQTYADTLANTFLANARFNKRYGINNHHGQKQNDPFIAFLLSKQQTNCLLSTEIT